VLAPQLPVELPVPLALGEPAEGYPYPWTVAPWIPGATPDADNLVEGPQYLRKPDGSFINITRSGVPLSGIAQGLTIHQRSTGDYIDSVSGARHGYQGRAGKYKSDIDLGVPATRIAGRDVNAKGNIVGFYADDGGDHGYLLDHSGLHTYDVDASGTTTFEGLSDKGVVTGQVVDEDFNNHGFTLDPSTGTATFIDVPGAASVQAWGINRKGMVALSTDIGSFIYCPLKAKRCPAGGIAAVERKVQVVEGRRAQVAAPRQPKRGPAR